MTEATDVQTVPQQQQQPGQQQAQAAPAGTNASLYVGDLHPEVTEAMLFEKFSEIGPLTTIRVCRDNVTRRSLGYAYVNYANPDDASKAIETLNYTSIKDRPCRIMWSQRDPGLRRSGTGNVFIKNLAKDVDNAALCDTFEQFGKILSCKIVTNSDGSSRGYGFVHFEQDKDAAAAIAKVNGMMLGSSKVSVGQFVSKAHRLDELSKAATQFTNLFIKNLPEDFKDDDLKALFAPFGEIDSLKVATSTEGTTKGFGFVAFKAPESAARAVEEMNGKEFRGKTLYVGRAQSKAERTALLRREYEKKRSERQQTDRGVNLFVKNLDESVTDDMLREKFAEFGTITSAVVMRDEKGVSKGFGFVCFSNSQEATNAQVNLNKYMFEGKPLYVALAQRKEDRKNDLAMQAQARMQAYRASLAMFPGGMPMGMPPGPMYMGPPGRGGFYGMMPGGRGGPRNFPGMAIPPQMMGAYGVPPMMPRGQIPRGGMSAVPGGRGGPRGPRGAAQAGVPRGGPRAGPQAMAYRAQPGANRGGPVQALVQPGQVPLTLEELTQAPEDQQKQILGERLYPLIHATEGESAGKITGMLLEMDTPEVLMLLDDPEALNVKVREAVAVLEEHSKTAQA